MYRTARGEGWVVGLALAAFALFGAGFVVTLECGLGHCAGPPVRRLLDLDAVGSLPRLFTTGVFLAVAALAWRARSRTAARPALWWSGVTVTGLGVAVLKAASGPTLVQGEVSPWTALLLGLAVAVPALCVLAAAGRTWGVTAAVPVVAALLLYASTALSLDVVTAVVQSVQDDVGVFSTSAATFVEEFGEALAALGVLAVVSRRGR
jgi:hypothetical protein